MSKYVYSTGNVYHESFIIERKHTIKIAKNVKWEHWHVMFSPFCIVRHPSLVQFGRLPKRQKQSMQTKLEGSRVHLNEEHQEDLSINAPASQV